MKEASIIIDGVRYDAVASKFPFSCAECEVPEWQVCGICSEKIVFKKSTKSFEL